MRPLIGLIYFVIAMGAGGLSYAQAPLPAPKGPVVLTISGKIEQTNGDGVARFDMDMLEALGRDSFATRWELSETPQQFEGVPLRAALERVGAQGKSLRASALNDYVAVIPMEDLKFEPILATKLDGRALTIRDKGPLWIVYPRDRHKVLQDARYDARWVWQLNKLHAE
ncbi:molybdopterin-dependent oxidoreductase [Microvirga splendida]|uniref:Molybdopterin-dependent oxidoreductase n=1 Tax=Microvirga splendida TaxID=2795727 RepID=A0ABS0Y185_9HYPH|nr:molybdopterin-dependent oxidoreductase [Microvirga splendida]MBJ6126072.1 molybdopterin-dependent oxidoreductase [Microvirga splendida]